MTRIAIVCLGLVVLFSCACGGGRTLQSIAVSPASADGASSPNGQVQFTASGSYSSAPVTATPPNLQWTVDYLPWQAQPEIITINTPTISATGVAQCPAAGANASAETHKILAIAANIDNAAIATDGSNAVVGSAQMTCP